LREVWWADLDEPVTLGSFARFLWWGCTLWAHRSYSKTALEGFKKMFTPRGGHVPPPELGTEDLAPVPASIRDRIQLFFFAILFLIVLPTWVLLGTLMRALRLPTFPSAASFCNTSAT
jgi:hypothetical protein